MDDWESEGAGGACTDTKVRGGRESTKNMEQMTAAIEAMVADGPPWMQAMVADGSALIMLVSIGVFLLLVANLHNLPQVMRGKAEILSLELHGYQLEFLDMLSEYEGHPGYALQYLVERAARESRVKAACFDKIHCVHCGSVNPAEWIKTAGIGNKQRLEWPLSSRACSLLKSRLILPVEKVGTPPKKQIVDGPRRVDASKAARCVIDWAIGNYDALTDEGQERFRAVCDDHLPLADHSLIDRAANDSGAGKKAKAE